MSVDEQQQNSSQVKSSIGMQEIGVSEIGGITTERAVVTAGEMTTDREEMWTSLHEVTAEGFLNRLTYLTSGAVATSDVSYSSIASFYPSQLLFANTSVADKLRYFGVHRGTVEVTMIVTVPSNAYGLYLLQALPEGGANGPYGASVGTFVEQGGAAYDTPFTATQGIHGMVDVSASNSVVLSLPFVFPIDAYDNTGALPDFGDSWRIVLWCLSSIKNSVNAEVVSGTYTIYARYLNDYQLGMPVLQSDKGQKLGKGFATNAMEKFSKAKQISDKLKSNKTVSNTSRSIGAAAATIGATIPFLAPMAGTVAAGAAAFTSIADYFGYTRESKPMDPMAVMTIPHSNLGAVDGYDPSRVIGLYQNNNTTTDPTVGGGDANDEMCFASLFQRWTIIDTFDWTTTDSAGKILRSIPVSPFVCAHTLGAYYPIVAGYVGLPFYFWRGGMEYRIMVPSSPFHRGNLQVLWQVSTQVGTFSTPPDNILPNHIIDATSSSTVDLSVAYTVPYMCLRNTGLLTPGSPYANTGERNVNGFLIFRVLNRLQATAGTSTVNVIVLARACADMRFGMPLSTNTFITGVSARKPFGASFTVQSGVIGDDAPTGVSVDLVGDGDNVESYPVDAVLWGEQFVSVRPLMQRFSLVYAWIPGSSVPPPLTFPHFLPPPVDYTPYVPLVTNYVFPNGNSLGIAPPWTWFSHYATMFVGVRGSVRWKIPIASNIQSITPTTADQLANFSTAGAFWVNSGTTSDPILTPSATSENAEYRSSGGGVEVTIPYYDQAKFWTYRFVSYAGSALGAYTQRMNVFQSTPQSTMYRMYYAAGPDIACIRFRRTPGIIAR